MDVSLLPGDENVTVNDRGHGEFRRSWN